MTCEHENSKFKIKIFEGDDGVHTFPCVTKKTASMLLCPSTPWAGFRRLKTTGLLDRAVSQVSGTSPRKGIHRLIPVTELIQLKPDLADIFKDTITID